MSISVSLESTRAGRRLLRSPGFALSIVLLIGLSIGGVAAVATAGWSLFARPLPYPQAEQLVTLSAYSNRFGMHMGLSEALVEELNRDGELGKYALLDQPSNLRLRDGTVLRAARTDHRLVGVLGLAPLMGRAFVTEDTEPGAEPVALIGERTWRRQFGADPEILDRRLVLEDGSARIVGVLPDRLAMPEADTQVWLPIDLGPEATSPESVGNVGALTIVARWAGAVSTTVLEKRLQGRLGTDPRLQTIQNMLSIEYRVRPLRSFWAAGHREGLLILGAATVVVLLAAWLNIAGLWLARWTARGPELAIQSALGANRGAALIGITLEYLLLAVPGGLLGLLVAGLGLELLFGLGVMQESGPLRPSIAGFTLGIGSVLAAVGILPVLFVLTWQTRRIASGVSASLGGKGIASRGRGAGLQRMLMAGQIGIAFSILISLGLLLGSWMNLLNQDLGFDKEGLLVAQIVSADGASSESEAGAEVVVDRLRALPGVDAVSWSNVVPFGRNEMLSSIRLEDRPDESVPARPRLIGPDFFRIAGIELLAGRRFGLEDHGENVANVIVDSAFQNAYMNGDALGRRFKLASGSDRYTDATVVGVVASVRHMSPDETLNHPTFYTPSADPGGQVQLLIRSSTPLAVLAQDVRGIIEGELGADRLDFVSTLESLVRRTVRDREPQLVLMMTFGGLALLLVFYGLYALESFRVAARTSEIGLRKAMGATDRGIVASVLGNSMWLLAPGLAIGLPGAWLSSRLIRERLFEVSVLNPWLWVLVACALAVTVLLASLVPALRATRVEPLEALRYE